MTALRWCLWLVAANLTFASSSAAQVRPQNVLILNSFESDNIRVGTVISGILRTELSRQFSEPINFFEVSLQPAFGDESREVAVLNYLRSAFAGDRLSLVVTLGGPAATFAQKYRERLFPTTPKILASVDRRWVQATTLAANETTLAAAIDPPRIIEDILQLLPETTTVYVVIGASPVEQIWRDEMSRGFQRFEDRLRFVYFNDLSFAEMLKRSAALPPHSVILFGFLSVDAKGISYLGQHTLTELRAEANSPIFGFHSSQLGLGIVGGSLIPIEEMGRNTAGAALRILRGESPSNIKTAVQGHGRPIYDWRELQRWSISDTLLPMGSIVLFRQPSVWDQYKFYIIAAMTILGFQGALIAGLVVNRARRHRVELALRESERHFRVMADTAPVLIWRSGVDMAGDFFNKPWLDFRGRTLEQEQGSGWREGIHPEDVERCLDLQANPFAPEEPFQREYRLRRADGEYRWVLDVGVPRYHDDGHLAGYIGSALDITERKHIEQSFRESEAALRRSYEQNQDLAGRLINAQEVERARIARDLHDDVSQRVAGISIMLSALKRKVGKVGAEPDIDRAFTALQDCASTLCETIRNMSHELHPSVLQAVGLAATLERHCAEVEELHHLKVIFRADCNLDALSADAALSLFRVAQEALSNAVRHARPRTIQVELMAAGDRVTLRVADDGVGFVTDERTGRGLGLRSMDERVRLAQGHVDVKSGPGQGTRVLVRMPFAAAPIKVAGQA
jgi:PAS domain S-box-containing protein